MKERKRAIKLSILAIYLIVIAVLALVVLLFALLYGGGGAGLLAADAHKSAPQTPGGDLAVIAHITPAPTSTPVPSLEGRLFPYLENGMWGYKNAKGQTVIEASFSAALEFDGNVAFAAKNGLYGLINRKAVFIEQPQWKNALPFSEGYAAVLKDSLWGYIDANGEVAIDYSFREAKSFHCGRAAVRNGAAYGYIDTQGVPAIGEKWRDAGDFSEDVAFAISNEYEKDRQYIINKVGVKVATLSPSSLRGTAFSEGFAVIRDTDKAESYFINSEGSSAFHAVFEDALSFSGGYAAVKSDGKWGYINTRGVTVIEPQFSEALGFSGGFAAVRDGETGLWGYADGSGVLAIEPQYDEALQFLDGYAVVRLGNAYFIINKDNAAAPLYEVP